MSCLFNSLSYFIDMSSMRIRQRICDYLQDAKTLLPGIDTRTLLELEAVDAESYIRHMRLASTWGGAIEIRAACDIWNFDITVMNERDRTRPTRIEFVSVNADNGEPARKISLCWTGGHYEPVR